LGACLSSKAVVAIQRHQCAVGRFNPKLAAFRQRLFDKGMAPKAALIAAARRLLTILNALVRSGQSWNPRSA
jgi:transposase